MASEITVTKEPMNPATGLMSIIEGLAANPQVDIDKLHQLLQMQERWEVNNDKKKFREAMAAFKLDPPEIVKNKHVSFKTDKGQTDWSGPWFCHQPTGTKSETITPKQSADFWFGFQTLSVEPGRWTMDYYRDRMDHLYEVMRGRPNQGVSFDEKALTPRQAAQVINIFSEYLDANDLRLDVPKDRDYLASSYDGGYSWCEKCGAIAEDDRGLCKKRKCPLREEDEANA